MADNSYSRRDFIKTMGAGSAAFSLFGCSLSKEQYIAPIGLQLYTLRSIIFDDFPGTIKKIADMGYVGVETWGGLSENIELQLAAKTLKDAGLQVLGCHVALPTGENRDSALKMADAYNSDKLIYPAPGKYDTKDELKQTLEDFNSVSADLRKQGLDFGLHNHQVEFKMAASGVMPFYYLLENLSEDIFFEIDTYWAQTAGYEAAKAVKDFGARAPLLHIKDGTTDLGNKYNIHVPTGTGAMDIPAIAKAGGENTKWMIVEFDDFEIDIMDGLQKSYQYLTKNKFAKGNI